jgi:ArsR family transcriptional regulator, lead/cadmium/zinc/bismuth-responsive transcriptional repressor
MLARAAVAVRPKLLRDEHAAALAETFKALGDVTRVRILDALSRTELCVGDVAALLGSSESAVSHQLRLLRSLRLVRARREGRLVYYSLDDDHIVGLFAQGLEHVQEKEGGPAAFAPSALRRASPVGRPFQGRRSRR